MAFLHLHIIRTKSFVHMMLPWWRSGPYCIKTRLTLIVQKWQHLWRFQIVLAYWESASQRLQSSAGNAAICPKTENKILCRRNPLSPSKAAFCTQNWHSCHEWYFLLIYELIEMLLIPPAPSRLNPKRHSALFSLTVSFNERHLQSTLTQLGVSHCNLGSKMNLSNEIRTQCTICHPAGQLHFLFTDPPWIKAHSLRTCRLLVAAAAGLNSF